MCCRSHLWHNFQLVIYSCSKSVKLLMKLLFFSPDGAILLRFYRKTVVLLTVPGFQNESLIQRVMQKKFFLLQTSEFLVRHVIWTWKLRKCKTVFINVLPIKYFVLKIWRENMILQFQLTNQTDFINGILKYKYEHDHEFFFFISRKTEEEQLKDLTISINIRNKC